MKDWFTVGYVASMGLLAVTAVCMAHDHFTRVYPPSSAESEPMAGPFPWHTLEGIVVCTNLLVLALFFDAWYDRRNPPEVNP